MQKLDVARSGSITKSEKSGHRGHGQEKARNCWSNQMHNTLG